MPIKKSAKKYMRVTARKSALNKKAEGVFRSAIKKTKTAVSGEKKEDAQKWLRLSIKALDKAAQKGIIKKKTAARKKSRLNKLVKSVVKK